MAKRPRNEPSIRGRRPRFIGSRREPVGQLNRLGALQGRVITDGNVVFGACVVAEDAAGNIVSGTVTEPDGRYVLPALAPGNYQVRATPLYSLLANPAVRLVSGADIGRRFANAETSFLPTANKTTGVAPGITNEVDFSVLKGEPGFLIARLRPAAREQDELAAINSPAMIRVGQGNLVIGVYSPGFPSTGATLTVTGGGLMLGPASFVRDAFPNVRPSLNLLSIAISVDRNATPGLRSFIVQQGTNIAYANGFLEILPAFSDDNFDGLDDSFQRRYFPRFTAAEAAPSADPDGDNFSNNREWVAGTDPTNRLSVLRIERASVSANGTTIVWQSVAGKRYQVFRNLELEKGAWEPVGAAVMAAGPSAQFLDSSSAIGARFYRVQVRP
ncbi:MAG: carboxypeptidase regulatory-like domain-containing protein [Verrucomicrobia bacterium]|nr:carboxypeptidase regulatory-like domain-containing protein [Verrucomicrobiota bacterium]